MATMIIPERMSIRHGNPPCTGAGLAFFDPAGLNFAI
jgi:hypothetical protein